MILLGKFSALFVERQRKVRMAGAPANCLYSESCRTVGSPLNLRRADDLRHPHQKSRRRPPRPDYKTDGQMRGGG